MCKLDSLEWFGLWLCARATLSASCAAVLLSLSHTDTKKCTSLRHLLTNALHVVSGHQFVLQALRESVQIGVDIDSS